MELIDVILSKENLNRAYKKVDQSEEYTFRKTMVRKDHWEYRQQLTGLSSRQ